MFPFLLQWLQGVQAGCVDCFIRSFADPTARASIVDGLCAGRNGVQPTDRLLTDDQAFLLIKLGLREFLDQKFIGHDEFQEFLASPDGIERFGDQLDAADPTTVHPSWLVDYDTANT